MIEDMQTSEQREAVWKALKYDISIECGADSTGRLANSPSSL